MKARSFFLLLLLAIVALAATSTPTLARSVGPGNDFDRLAIDLIRFHALGILQGDYESGVTFNADLARQFDFSDAAIRLGEQVAVATNDLIAQAKEAQRSGKVAQVTGLYLDGQRYPDLQRFWVEAAKRNSQGMSALDHSEFFAKEVEPLGVQGVSHVVCGYYPNPKPSTNGPWTTHNNISNPAATLRSWGYHETWPPDYTGGGWTRPQTYQPLLCGWGTYRDHAFIAGPTTIREQNYTGSPGGEPNPEVYRSGPWPYPDWPAYVYWWHVYGPGR